MAGQSVLVICCSVSAPFFPSPFVSSISHSQFESIDPVSDKEW